MSRREVLKRVGLGAIYIPAYVFVLYPAAFVGGILLGLVDVGYILVTGEKPDYVGRFVKETWRWTGQNVGYILSGHGEFEALPRPVAERELRA